MKSQLEKASLSAKKNAPILLTEETRIEKDFIAQVLHNESCRYTNEERKGQLQEANGGTLLIDHQMYLYKQSYIEGECVFRRLTI